MISYYLIAPVLILLGHLPSNILYKLSDVIAFMLCRIVRYRREVVLTNIRNSFPEKSESEHEKIADESYRHLADRVVENLKCLSISKEEVHQRIQVFNLELIHEYYRKKKSVVVLVGHIGSWELGGYKASLSVHHKTKGIVSLLTNPHFNDLIQRTRGRMGMELIGMKYAKDFFSKPLDEPSVIIFIGDQSPSNPSNAYWTKFLNQDTAFFSGGERYARTHNCAVVYVEIKQKQRGFYDIHVHEICEQPELLPEYAITQKFTELLEKTIKSNPSDWLWSHRRWKHKRKPATD